MLSLPVRFGGLGIANPSETADREYNASRKVTADLRNLIMAQQQDMSLYSSERTIAAVKEVKSEKEAFLKQKFQDLLIPLKMVISKDVSH